MKATMLTEQELDAIKYHAYGEGRADQLEEDIKALSSRQTSAEMPEAAVVGWFESPHGAFRANPLYRLQPRPQTLSWSIPLIVAPVAPATARSDKTEGGIS